MSLRMDDIVQKENSMKLTMQTIDFRLAKLEEISLQTAETLCLLEQALASSQLREPEVVGSGSNSSVDIPSLPARGRGYSLDTVQLTHKRNRMAINEDRLRPFTDYTRQRPPFSRSVTVAAPGHHVQERHSAAVPTKKPQKSSGLSNYTGSDLFRRRRSKVLSKLRSQGLLNAVNQNFGKTPSRRSQVTFSNQSSCDTPECMSPLSIRTDLSSTPVVTPVKTLASSHTIDSPIYTAPGVTSPIVKPSKQSHLEDEVKVMSPPTSLRVPNLDNPEMAAEVATSAALAISPIVTPVHSEYTSITDDIDTSQLNYRSPEGSPTNLHQFLYGIDVDVDLYTKKPPKKKKTKVRSMVPSKYELEQLRHAEAEEHEQLENVIRKRMRQISLTESDSLGDIARHIIEMDMTDVEVEAPAYHSDEGDHLKEEEEEEAEAAVDAAINKVKSEPLLTALSGSVDSQNWTNMAEGSILSAPINMQPSEDSERTATFFVSDELVPNETNC